VEVLGISCAAGLEGRRLIDSSISIDISDNYPQNANMGIASLDASEYIGIVMLLFLSLGTVT